MKRKLGRRAMPGEHSLLFRVLPLELLAPLGLHRAPNRSPCAHEIEGGRGQENTIWIGQHFYSSCWMPVDVATRQAAVPSKRAKPTTRRPLCSSMASGGFTTTTLAASRMADG